MNGPSSPREYLAFLASFGPRIARAGWVGAVAFGVGLTVTVVLVLSTSRQYRSEAVVLYERGVLAKSVGGEGETASAMAARVHDMLMSRQRLEGVIKEMKLYRGIVDKRGLGEAIDEMRKHIIIAGREGYTYKVSYDGETRDLAKGVLDTLLASIVDEDRQRRARDVKDTKQFLESERQRADEDLKTKESALASFLTKHPQLAGEVGGATASAGGLIRAADRDRSSAGGGDVAALELQAAQLEESLAAAGVRAPSAKASEPPLDPALAAARTRADVELQSARRELADKQTHLTNEHPDVKQALRHVAAAEAAARRADAAAAAWQPPAPGTEAAATDDGGAEGARVAALKRALAAVRAQIGAVRSRAAPRAQMPQAASSVVEIDTGWTRLNRDVSEARERQSQLESKEFQAQLAGTLIAGGQGGQLVITDPPFRPSYPISGGRSKVALVGLAGAFALAIMVMGAFAAFDDRLYGARDVESVLGDGIVVVVPSAPRRLTAVGGDDTKGVATPAGTKGG